jgi:hypothetical protein
MAAARWFSPGSACWVWDLASGAARTARICCSLPGVSWLHVPWLLPPLPLQFNPDRVVFINDVHFCANDLLRLVLHRADLACGLDMVVDQHRGQLFYDFWWVLITATSDYCIGVGCRELIGLGSRWLQTAAAYGASLAGRMPASCRVMRDVAGARVWDTHPFFKHQPSIDRLKEGLPLPAQ